MKKIKRQLYFKSLFWFLGAGFFLVSAVMGSFVGALTNGEVIRSYPQFGKSRGAVRELARIGLLDRMSPELVAEVLDYQWQSGKSLAQVLQDPVWCHRLGLSKNEFKVTWYLSNPFDVLPPALQKSIHERKTPFRSRTHVFEWSRANKMPKIYREALYKALIETTPENLWRASQGHRPYAKNGEFLEPIVIEHGKGTYEVRDGHIATDPRVIPTNQEVLLLVKVNGEDRVLKVKATDIGGAIKGKHVDLPIKISPEFTQTFPNVLFPSAVSNPSVQILTLPSASSIH